MDLIGSTTTRQGLRASLDPRSYATSIKITDEELAAVPITKHRFTASGTTRSTPASQNYNGVVIL